MDAIAWAGQDICEIYGPKILQDDRKLWDVGQYATARSIEHFTLHVAQN